MRIFLLFLMLFLGSMVLRAQEKASFKLGVLKYGGGGDWYADPTALPNLSDFCRRELGMNLSDPDFVDVGSAELFNYPFVHMTGHGNVVFNPAEAANLRKYLQSGGFLHIDDNYGMDPFIRPQMKRVFPELDFIELPNNHPIYNQRYTFPNGIPKIHEHDGKPAQGFGLFWEGRLVCYYTFETDLSDGWEDAEVHGNSEPTRQKSLQMGANIVQYVFSRE